MAENVKPSRDEIAREVAEASRIGHPDFKGDRPLWRHYTAADAILALLPGRTEAEVKAEAWDEGYKASEQEFQQVYDLTTPDEDRFVAKNPHRA